MPERAKPGADWPTIKARFLAGETAYSIAKTAPVSRQAIEKRAKSEGWKDQRPQVGESATQMVAQVGVGTWLDRCQDMTPVGPKDTPETRALIAQLLSEGFGFERSAKAAGISRATLDRYREADPAFDTVCRDAQLAWERLRHHRLEAASNRGDARVDQWWLERHPETRTEYAGARAGAAGGPVINIQLNVPRDLSGQMPKAGDRIETIDVTPDGATISMGD